jgi:hypothetical protein
VADLEFAKLCKLGRNKTGGRNNEEQTFSHFVFDGFSAGTGRNRVSAAPDR